MPKSFADYPVWIDATGLLRWGPQPCTGVQRVELGLIEFALNNPNSTGLCLLDPATRRYHMADENARVYLRNIVAVNRSKEPSSKQNRLAHLGTQLHFADRESGRRLAADLTGDDTRSGLAYSTTKTLLRLMLWSYAGLRFIRGLITTFFTKRPNAASTEDNQPKPFLLVSHEVNRVSYIARSVMAAGCREANIIYDLIPVRLPRYTTPRFTRKMGELFKRVLTQPTTIIAISQTTRDDLVDWGATQFGITSTENILTCALNNSIQSDPAFDVPIAQIEGKRFAMMCSTIDIRKGQWLLVATWNRLSKILPAEDLPDLVLIGRKGSGWEELEQELTAAKAISHKIHVLHGVKDSSLQWAYRNAEFCLFPSVAEGWGLGVSEALAHGKPVIHSDIAILHEAAQGLMPSAPPLDVAAWTDLLVGILSTPGRIAELTEIAQTHYKAGKPDDFARGVFNLLSERFDQVRDKTEQS